jgi:hypothetical protein
VYTYVDSRAWRELGVRKYGREKQGAGNTNTKNYCIGARERDHNSRIFFRPKQEHESPCLKRFLSAARRPRKTCAQL